uniref:Uncharacterized protein TCIL3000_11_8520 n=1 Tax=Trypanosoma congolense (strain IL3000) TaxID=1068625 RepID=G0V177_TRYCI|nr:unnamed protein product [Trypanosoma congolense IL3000]
MIAYGLEDILPSLARQVSSVAHYYQLIPEKHIPFTFSRSNAPLKAPRRPFIAAILAVLIQLNLLRSNGVYVSLSAFDRWFMSAVNVEYYPIARFSLHAKVYIAGCIAERDKISEYGQGIVRDVFQGLDITNSLKERTVWMIGKSLCPDALHIYRHGEVFVEALRNSFNDTKSSFIISMQTPIWYIWRETFSTLDSFISTPAGDRSVADKGVLFSGVKYSIDIIIFLTENLCRLNDGHEPECIHLEPIIYAGTAGEFAAVCLFCGIKKAVREHFSETITCRQYIVESTEAMSKLFSQIFSHFTCLVPNKRHYLFLDTCETLLKILHNTGQHVTKVADECRSGQRCPRIFEEDVFISCVTKTERRTALSVEGPLTFSNCNSESLEATNKLDALRYCFDRQYGETEEVNEILAVDNSNPLLYLKCISIEDIYPLSNESSYFRWCNIYLPPETGEENDFIEQFIRRDSDYSTKLAVDIAVASAII